MRDDPFDLAARLTVPANLPRRRELLFEFRVGHRVVSCELCYLGEWGVEAQFVESDAHVGVSRRFVMRAEAVEWAQQERDAMAPSDVEHCAERRSMLRR